MFEKLKELSTMRMSTDESLAFWIAIGTALFASFTTIAIAS